MSSTGEQSSESASALLAMTHERTLALREMIGRVIVGQDHVVMGMLIALFARGHALFVGVPGLAKTLLVSSLAKALGQSFGRVQFTPDLLPADITGIDIFAEQDGRRSLVFAKGPIFHNLVLADEINRTPPKTQSALLEAMQERRVTVGTVTHDLPDPFQVFATQNPIEQEGTYPLPEAQLDRFLLQIHVDYPSESEEIEIAKRTTRGATVSPSAVLGREDVLAIQGFVPKVPVTDEAVRFAVKLARLSRPGQPGSPAEVRDYVRFGAGPRGSQSLVIAAKAHAVLHGQAAADLGDVRAVAELALRHRLVLSYKAEADRVRDSDVVKALLRAAAS